MKNRLASATSSALTSMWSIRGGAMPGRSGGGTGDGLRLPRMLPVFSMSQTSSMICPDGTSKRIDSPCPTDSPRDIRVIWQP